MSISPTVVLLRFAMEHSSPAERQEYLREHPQADPKNHVVVEPDKHRADKDENEEELKEIAADLTSMWKYPSKDKTDPVSSIISALRSGKGFTKDELKSAFGHTEKLLEKNPDSKTLALVKHLLEDLEPDAKENPAKTPDKAPDKTPEKSSPKAPEEVERPKDNGVGPHKIQHSDDKLHAQMEHLATRVTVEQSKQYGGKAPAAIAIAVGKKQAEEAAKWCNSWETTSGEKRVETVVKALSEPGSWAQAEYYATQGHLKARLAKLQEQGIADKDGYITLYRGVTGDQADKLRKTTKSGKDCVCKNRELTSWSSDIKVARKFGRGSYRNLSGKGIVLKQKIHYSRIFAVHSAQRGWSPESEYIVLSPEKQIVATLQEKLS